MAVEVTIEEFISAMRKIVTRSNVLLEPNGIPARGTEVEWLEWAESPIDFGESLNPAPKISDPKPGDIRQRRRRHADFDAWTEERSSARRPDLFHLWSRLESDDIDNPSISLLKDLALRKAPDELVNSWPSGPKGLSNDLAAGMLLEYVHQNGDLDWNQSIAASVCNSAIGFLDAGYALTRHVWLIPEFDAAREFALGSKVRFRMLTRDQIASFGLHDDDNAWGRGGDPEMPEPFELYYPAWTIETKPAIASNQLSERREQRILAEAALRLAGLDDARLIHLWSLPAVPYRPEYANEMFYWRPARSRFTHDEVLLTPFSYLDQDAINELESVGDPLNRVFGEENSHYIRPALVRLVESWNREDSLDSLVDCVVGIETLLGERGESIGFKLRMRASVLLHQSVDEREQTSRWLADVYDVRSSLLHDGKLSKLPNRWKYVPIQHQLDRARTLLRQLIQYCLKNFPGHQAKDKLMTHADRLLLT